MLIFGMIYSFMFYGQRMKDIFENHDWLGIIRIAPFDFCGVSEAKRHVGITFPSSICLSRFTFAGATCFQPKTGLHICLLWKGFLVDFNILLVWLWQWPLNYVHLKNMSTHLVLAPLLKFLDIKPTKAFCHSSSYLFVYLAMYEL